MTYLMQLLALAAVVGWFFQWLHMPVAWMIGPMLVGILAAFYRGEAILLPQPFRVVGQGLVGLVSGLSFPIQTLPLLVDHAIPLIIAVVITVGLSLCNGYLMYRWAGLNKATGLMGSLPGASGTMVVMSDEIGADAMVVAVMQYVRLFAVIFLTPFLVVQFLPPASLTVTVIGAAAEAFPAAAAPAPAGLLVSGVLLLIAGAVGAVAARRLRLPSPNFLGPFLSASLLSWSLPISLTLPDPAFMVGLLFIGLGIGLRFELKEIHKLGRVVLMQLAIVIVLILLCLAGALLFHQVTGIDTMTAALGLSFGGMDAMVATSVQLGADTGIVLAMHMTRYMVIMVLVPLVIARLKVNRT